MSIYFGVGSTARRVKNVYLGVNGTAREVKKAYIGVGNVARLWAAIYVWKKYTVVNTTEYAQSESQYGIMEYSLTTYITLYQQFGWRPALGVYTVSGPSISVDWRTCDSAAGRYPYYLETEKKLWTINSGYNSNGQFRVTGDYRTIISTTVPTQGDYIEDVTALTESEYPDNGMSGSYWYVKQ